jgi:lipid-A-disaccharide synthase
MRIFFSVGEPSGDVHGANLIRTLRAEHSDWQFVGFGGPKMAAAGCQLHTDLTQLAVMWVWEVLTNLRTFFRLVAEADRTFETERPDAVVLIDYPGFNWHIARKAKARGIPVFYYGVPQIWAWASWRVSKMRRYVDHVLCKLPFEEQWFRDRGCEATYVGHPFFDEMGVQKLDEAFLRHVRCDSRPLVTILPGSRTQEINHNLAPFLRAAERIRNSVPEVRFAIAVFKASQRPLVEGIVAGSGVEVEIFVGRTQELMNAAKCCLACSGSVSLELLHHEKPTAILYRVSLLGYFVQRFFRKVRYITLVNLLTADNPFPEGAVGVYDPRDLRDAHVLMPEYLTCTDRTEQLAQHVIDWLTVDFEFNKCVRGLATLKKYFGHAGASQRAARYISQVLDANPVFSTGEEYPDEDSGEQEWTSAA